MVPLTKIFTLLLTLWTICLQASAKQCIHHMYVHKSLDYVGTQMHLASATYLELKMHVNSVDRCVQLCCNYPLCNIALYNAYNGGNGLAGSCSLVKCLPLGKCAWKTTVTVNAAMLYRGTKVPNWPKAKHAVIHKVQNFKHTLINGAPFHPKHRLRRDSNDQAQLPQMSAKTVPPQAQPETKPPIEQHPKPEIGLPTGPGTKSTGKKITISAHAENVNDVHTTPKPAKTTTSTTTKKPPTHAPAIVKPKEEKTPAPKKVKPHTEPKKDTHLSSGGSGFTLPKDAQTGTPLKPSEAKTGIPNVHVAESAPALPGPPATANITSVKQIANMIDELSTASVKSGVDSGPVKVLKPSVKSGVESGPVKVLKPSVKSGVESGPVKVLKPTESGVSPLGNGEKLNPESKPLTKTATKLGTGKVASDQGEDEFKQSVSPHMVTMSPDVVTVSPKLTETANKYNKDVVDKPNGKLKRTTRSLLRRTTRSLTPGLPESTYERPAEPKPTPPQPTKITKSEIKKIYSEVDKEDGQGNASVKVDTLAPVLSNTTVPPSPTPTAGTGANTTASPETSTAEPALNRSRPEVDEDVSLTTETPSTANQTASTTAGSKIETTSQPEATTPPIETTEETATEPTEASTEKPTSSTEKPTSSSEKPTTSTEKPTTTTEKPTTSTEKPTTSTEKPTTTSTERTTTQDLQAILAKLLGTSKPPVQTETSQTKVTVTASGKKTTISITNQNTTPVNTSNLHAQPPLNHSAVTMNGSLVAALSFGCIFLFGVVLLLGKRCYDGYQRRHYSKVDYLVNGMYN